MNTPIHTSVHTHTHTDTYTHAYKCVQGGEMRWGDLVFSPHGLLSTVTRSNNVQIRPWLWMSNLAARVWWLGDWHNVAMGRTMVRNHTRMPVRRTPCLLQQTVDTTVANGTRWASWPHILCIPKSKPSYNSCAKELGSPGCLDTPLPCGVSTFSTPHQL